MLPSILEVLKESQEERAVLEQWQAIATQKKKAGVQRKPVRKPTRKGKGT